MFKRLLEFQFSMISFCSGFRHGKEKPEARRCWRSFGIARSATKWVGSHFAEIRGAKQRTPPIEMTKVSHHAPLAQLVEQLTLNQWVPGSNP